MPLRTGAHAERITRVRELQTGRGRREQGRFVLEGPTLLNEALDSGCEVLELYATETAFESIPLIEELEGRGVGVFIIEDRVAGRLSALETPPGLIAVAPTRFASVRRLLEDPLTLALADVNDPGNAGTLIRSAAAFGATGMIFGRFGADPYQSKVVRASMGAIFRIPFAVATADDVLPELGRTGRAFAGLASDGEPIGPDTFHGMAGLVVGNERRGLGHWGPLCGCRVSIPMRDSMESLNAGIAGSIALYEASKSLEVRRRGPL